MALTSKIGRKSTSVRLLYVSIYALLTFGAITMVYPFLLMISGSMKSALDVKYFNAIPRFITDDSWLYKKHMQGLFNEDLSAYHNTYSNDEMSFEEAKPPKQINEKMVNDYISFIKESDLPHYAYCLGYLEQPVSRTMGIGLRKYKAFLQKEISPEISVVNEKLGTDYLSWNDLYVQRERYTLRREKPVVNAFTSYLIKFKKQTPIAQKFYLSLVGFYRFGWLATQYDNIQELNKKNGTNYASFNDIPLPRTFPKDAPKDIQKKWIIFVRELIGMQYISFTEAARPLYQKFLQAKYETIDALNRIYKTHYKSFNEITIYKKNIFDNIQSADLAMFTRGWVDPTNSNKKYEAPLDSIILQSNDFAFQDYLVKKYGSLEKINKAFGTNYKSIAMIPMPQKEMHYKDFLQRRSEIKKEFIVRNYITVIDYLLLHGRGVMNTIIYCSLAILGALLINPLAAYSMSRYKLPSTYKILLLLLCTMAFPPMVTAIPNFLMLRHLGLLNTFAALILPGIANGYSIFLLKGFFDSHPQELYESASIDGASEWTIFWQIAMSLSKPILAVIALQAFNLAYSNFMLAFVVCQDEKMWTIMVWLYQLQQIKGQSVMYASLIIAAIPTFLIFLFCQNLIMRGIVVPSEK